MPAHRSADRATRATRAPRGLLPRLLRRAAAPVVVLAAAGVLVASQHPAPLPAPVAVGPQALVNWTGSYPTCDTVSSGTCTEPINPGNITSGGTLDAAYSQDCDVTEFSGNGNTSNLDASGNTLYDGWLFVTQGQQQAYDIRLSFTDTKGATQTWTPTTTTTPPAHFANSAYIYYTKNYSHIAVLTPRGWKLQSGTLLADGPNNKNSFNLSHGCAAGTHTSNHGTDSGECKYPPSPTVLTGSAVASGQTYTASGTLTENGCNVPSEPLQVTYGDKTTGTTTTSSTGQWSLTGLSATKFPLTLGHAATTAWPAAQSITVSKP